MRRWEHGSGRWLQRTGLRLPDLQREVFFEHQVILPKPCLYGALQAHSSGAGWMGALAHPESAHRENISSVHMSTAHGCLVLRPGKPLRYLKASTSGEGCAPKCGLKVPQTLTWQA